MTRTRFRIAAAAVLLLALALRLHGLAFGLPALNDPDELMFELGAMRLLRGGTLDPGWFGHPATTTFYLLAAINAGVFAGGWLAGAFADPQDFVRAIWLDPAWVILPGRAAMALFGVWSTWLAMRLGHALSGRMAGLLAGLLLAVNPVHAGWSQVIRSDVMALCFVQCAMLCALAVLRGRRRDWLAACFWVGCAAATKWPGALCVLPVLFAVGARARRERVGLAALLRRLAATGGASLGFLLLLSPYLVIDHGKFLRDIRGEAQVRHLGATGGGPFDNLDWYLGGPLLTGLGAVGLLLALLGACRLWRSRRARIALAPFTLATLAALAVQGLVWERWSLPLMPVAAVLAGTGLARVFAGLGRSRHRREGAMLAVVLVVLALAAPLLTLTQRMRERLDDTRQRATGWAAARIPPGSTILVEHFGFDMLAHPWRPVFPVGDAGCLDARALLAGRVSYRAIEVARGSRSNVDYGTLPARHRPGCRADYAILTQADRYFAEEGAFPAEAGAYRALIARGRLVAIIRPQAGRIGGPVVRIVAFPASGDRKNLSAN